MRAVLFIDQLIADQNGRFDLDIHFLQQLFSQCTLQTAVIRFRLSAGKGIVLPIPAQQQPAIPGKNEPVHLFDCYTGRNCSIHPGKTPYPTPLSKP